MDLLFLEAVFLTLAYQAMAECMDHRTNGKCEPGCYFDEYLTPNGRCQPCDEICNPKWGSMDECLKHFDQCNVGSSATYFVTHGISTTTPPSSDPNWILIAVVTGVIAVTLVTVLAVTIYLIRRNRLNRRKVCENCCLCCCQKRFFKPVPPTNDNACTALYVSGVYSATPRSTDAGAESQTEALPLNHQGCDADTNM